eukprot:Blabericola_migrator_1__9041@NODE_480_length_8144_cov_370_014362_g305_i1_p5_GENE_NODE_480_length_8144_cov_370_014362_g305_i1NODE_480_length_8144_cov_370_014362_g305_i1_p5_ORF_typecomplete_len227_score34_25ABC2_membrane_3/PF12698_7/0_0016_NODE_480_length_8144_cov_370_014362_g305_i158146494
MNDDIIVERPPGVVAPPLKVVQPTSVDVVTELINLNDTLKEVHLESTRDSIGVIPEVTEALAGIVRDVVSLETNLVRGSDLAKEPMPTDASHAFNFVQYSMTAALVLMFYLWLGRKYASLLQNRSQSRLRTSPLSRFLWWLGDLLFHEPVWNSVVTMARWPIRLIKKGLTKLSVGENREHVVALDLLEHSRHIWEPRLCFGDWASSCCLCSVSGPCDATLFWLQLH